MNLRLGLVGVSALAILQALAGSALAQSGVTTYTYDALGQLVSTTNPAGQTTTYTYDQAGNRTQMVSAPPAPTVGPVSLNVAYNTSGSVSLTPAGQYTSLSVAGAPAHGSASISGVAATYTPSKTYYGPDSFTYTATGPGGTSSPATVSVNVGNPAAPSAGNVGLSVGYNSSGSVALAPGGVYSSLALASNPSHGSASVSGTTASYTPSNGYYGSDSFTYTVSGPGGTSPAATVSVSIGNPPAPTAGNVGLSIGYNSAGSVTLAPGGIYASLALASNPSHGSASVSGSTASYTPSSGYYGADSFTYSVSGPGGTSPAATVSVSVGNPPAPTAGNVGLNVGYNSSGSVGLAPGGVYSSLALASNPSHGSASVSGTTASYTPGSGYYGSDSFTYSVSGPGGSNRGTVSVNVATPSAPSAGNVGLSVGYNSSGSVGLAPGGVYSSLTLASNPSHGSASVSGTTASYTPSSGYYGSDSFTYSVSGPGGSNTATVSVNVGNPPAPSAGNVGLSVGYNSGGSVTLAPGGVYSSLALASNPSHGSASVSGTTASYTPSSGYYGSDSFTYSVSGPGGSNSGTVSVNVATPPAPSAGNVGLSIGYNSSGSVGLAPGGVYSSLALASNPSHGSASVSGTSASYTPSSGYYGSDSFSYSVSGPGGSNTGTVSVNVATPPAPNAGNVGLSVGYNSSGSVGLAPGGVYSSLALASNPSHGSASVSGTTASYTPSSGYYGGDSFTYRVSGPGGSNTATVSVNVANPPPPTVSAMSLTVSQNTGGSVNPNIGGVYSSIAIASAPSHGSASVVNQFTITYTPSTGYTGSDSFTYTASGPGGTSSPAPVSVNIIGAPTAGEVDVGGIPVNSSYGFSLSPGGNWTSLKITSYPRCGSVQIYPGPDANASFSANGCSTGIVTFYYVAIGPGGTSAPAPVYIIVTS